MRVTGGHELDEDAVAVVRQAVSLAARRGHAQVTPLHIARAMLSAPALAGILHAACVRSAPPQTNALDLSVAVDLALGRLVMTRHGGDPAPSNAFVATLRRAQAHPYRRSTGGAGGKVNLEKLVVSVLDDPSVHRAVVRVAGFSSSQVRASVDASSAESSRAGWEVSASSPNPLPNMIRAGQGQPSLPHGSECQVSKAKTGAGRPAIFGGNELDETMANVPPWLGGYKDKTRIRLTSSGTGLQADAACRGPKFTELTATNLKVLCDALELRVPRHKNIVPGISITLLRCRSGVTRRRAGANPSGSSSSTWLLFLGRDGGGKMAVARDLASLVFGSYAEFTTLQVQGSPDIPARTGKHALKRPRSPENNRDLGGRLFETIVENPHRIIFIDGVDRLDLESEMRIKNGIVDGGMARGCNGGVVSLEDAIVVLSSSDFLDSRYMASSSSPWPRVKQRFNGQNHEEGDAVRRSRCGHGWDLNVCAVDGEEEGDNLADDEGILNVVDGVFLFN